MTKRTRVKWPQPGFSFVNFHLFTEGYCQAVK